jgi:hypothetical protein
VWRRGKGAGRVRQVAWRREGLGNGAARARARGGARRRQQPVPAEAGDGQGDKGGHVVGGAWRIPMGRPRKKGKWARGERKEVGPALNE